MAAAKWIHLFRSNMALVAQMERDLATLMAFEESANQRRTLLTIHASGLNPTKFMKDLIQNYNVDQYEKMAVFEGEVMQHRINGIRYVEQVYIAQILLAQYPEEIPPDMREDIMNVSNM